MKNCFAVFIVLTVAALPMNPALIPSTDEQTYEAKNWVSGEGAIYAIPAGVTVKAVKYRETGYDTTLAGSFECNDNDYTILWEKWDSPNTYSVSVSRDGVHWGSPIATGSGPLGITTITFPAQTARYIRITQTDADPTYHWSIYELDVHREKSR